MEDRSHLSKYVKIKHKIPKIKYLILWKESVPEDLDKELKGKVLTWSELMNIGKN